MFGIYTVADRVVERGVDYDSALHNFCSFAGQGGQVQVAVPMEDTDGTFEALSIWKEFYHPFSRVLDIFLFKYDNNSPDYYGKMKNAALQELCTDMVIGAEIEDRFCLWQRERWVELSNIMLESDYLAAMIPCVNLANGERNYSDVSLKWSLHRRKGLRLGIPNYAKKENGEIDGISKDGLDLIDSDGNFPNMIYLTRDTTPSFLLANRIPFVFNLSKVNTITESKPHNLELWR